MPSDLPLDEAYLTAIWLETLLYGINLSLFCIYLYVVRYKRRTSRLSRALLFSAIAMIILSTVHVALGFRRLIEGFIFLRGEPGGPAMYFGDVSLPLNVAKVVVHTVNSIIGDGIVVWRCYHIWSRKAWACIFPILLIIGSAVCGFGQGIMFATATDARSAFATEVDRWNGALFVSSLVTNVTVTALIALRVWYQARKASAIFDWSSFKYKRVLAAVIESGMIYSSVLVIEIVLYFLSDNAFYIVYDPIAQLTGIVPTMIIIMSSLGITSGRTDTHSIGTNTIASISVPDLEHNVTSQIHTSSIPETSNSHPHYYTPHNRGRRTRPVPLPLALEMTEQSKPRNVNFKGAMMSRHDAENSADYLPSPMESPTSPMSPMSGKTAVSTDSVYDELGEYGMGSLGSSWTTYNGHLKGRDEFGTGSTGRKTARSSRSMSESYVVSSGSGSGMGMGGASPGRGTFQIPPRPVVLGVGAPAVGGRLERSINEKQGVGYVHH